MAYDLLVDDTGDTAAQTVGLMMPGNEDEQTKLKRFIARRHPEYSKMLPHWQFVIDCYEGGRAWFHRNIFRYVKEGNREYHDRVHRGYRFNHTREVVDLVDKYLFKMDIFRAEDDVAPCIKQFWHDSTLNGLPVKELMKQVSKLTSIYGRIWIVTDTTNTANAVLTKADEKQANIKTYAYIVTPENVCDMSYDEMGNLNWILIHEQSRDDNNPLNSTGRLIDRFRLWERDQYTLFTVVPKNNGAVVPNTIPAYEFARRVAEIARSGTEGQIGIADPNLTANLATSAYDIQVSGPFPHDFGAVPVFSADCSITHEQYTAPSLIDDVAYLDRAVANYLSNLDAIIQDQTFSQLIIPAQSLMSGDEGYDKLVEMGSKRLFTYDAEGGNAPAYISPDVKQADIVLKVISKIINEIYHTVGLAGERTKEDNSQGIDNSSGVAKAYDFERVNSLLAAKAASLQLIENKLAIYVAQWNGLEVNTDPQKPFKPVKYPSNFDVRGLYDEFEIAARLALIQAPDTVRQTQMESVIKKLFPRIKQDLKDKMIAELASWPPEPVMNQPGAPSGSQVLQTQGDKSLANKLVKDNK